MWEGLFAYPCPADDSLISSFILCFHSASLSSFVKALTSAFTVPLACPGGYLCPVACRAVKGVSGLWFLGAELLLGDAPLWGWRVQSSTGLSLYEQGNTNSPGRIQ